MSCQSCFSWRQAYIGQAFRILTGSKVVCLQQYKDALEATEHLPFNVQQMTPCPFDFHKAEENYLLSLRSSFEPATFSVLTVSSLYPIEKVCLQANRWNIQTQPVASHATLSQSCTIHYHAASKPRLP